MTIFLISTTTLFQAEFCNSRKLTPKRQNMKYDGWKILNRLRIEKARTKKNTQ